MLTDNISSEGQDQMKKDASIKSNAAMSKDAKEENTDHKLQEAIEEERIEESADLSLLSRTSDSPKDLIV